MAFVPILSLYFLSKNIIEHNSVIVAFLKKCGVNSLFLFALHGPVYEILFPIANKIGMNDYMVTAVALVVTIPICLYVGNLINRYAPFLIGKKKYIKR